MLPQKRTEAGHFSQSAVPKSKTNRNKADSFGFVIMQGINTLFPSCAVNAVLQINIPIALAYNVLTAEREKGEGFGEA